MKGYRFPQFIKLPNGWIESGGLKRFSWDKEKGGADHIAALMVLLAVAHRVDEVGIAKITYDEFEKVLPIRREKIAAGIQALIGFDIVAHEPRGQSTFKLIGFADEGLSWAKLPAKGLYVDGRIWGLKDFTLRKAAELHALKIYFLLVSRRDTVRNETRLSYPKIEEFSGVLRGHIKTATSLLIENHLMSTDSITDWEAWGEKKAFPHCYRIAHIDNYKHAGTLPTSVTDLQDRADKANRLLAKALD
ncbi:hypothetical protein HFO28_13770 [Rhizobium leguminosarum]|uniref:hypothetical protein n=1 Tax=Rhizobium leguminosarum TaxID=384 RepID=UPI001C93D60B|nr:hypothetical protein [Rhizobium leguminosarum]MBY5744648.1 hypothetical protein [Rhizobium leguminosarum]